MADNFRAALIEFAATTAALNARALKRAGLLDDAELGAMHAMLEFVDRHADLEGVPGQKSLAKSLLQILPPED